MTIVFTVANTNSGLSFSEAANRNAGLEGAILVVDDDPNDAFLAISITSTGSNQGS